jgi:hypothetical protein
MFDNLTALGYSLVTFSVVIGVGIIILYNFGGSIATCASGSSWNATAGGCWNGTATATPTGTAYTAVSSQATYLGTSGLAGWTPAIIAFSVGMLFLGAFFIKKGRSY